MVKRVPATKRTPTRAASPQKEIAKPTDKQPLAEYVVNPNTGKTIRVGGPTYVKVFGKASVTGQVVTKRRPSRASADEEVPKILVEQIVAMKTATVEELKDTLERTTQPSLRRLLAEQIKKQRDARGSRTRGWAASAPKPGKPRQVLKRACGDSAFLMPKELKFPIVAKCGSGQEETKCNCKVDCRGVLAALIRARQYGYTNVANAARHILDTKCKQRAAVAAAMAPQA